ncbi:hypothetical protein D3C86_1684620 [compost metagenome]
MIEPELAVRITCPPGALGTTLTRFAAPMVTRPVGKACQVTAVWNCWPVFMRASTVRALVLAEAEAAGSELSWKLSGTMISFASTGGT